MRPGLLKQHIADDLLSLYAVGKGLSLPEIVEIREHLWHCDVCRASLAKKHSVLSATGSLQLRPSFR